MHFYVFFVGSSVYVCVCVSVNVIVVLSCRHRSVLVMASESFCCAGHPYPTSSRGGSNLRVTAHVLLGGGNDHSLSAR